MGDTKSFKWLIHGDKFRIILNIEHYRIYVTNKFKYFINWIKFSLKKEKTFITYILYYSKVV